MSSTDILSATAIGLILGLWLLWVRPVLDLWFDCWLFQISTEILTQTLEQTKFNGWHDPIDWSKATKTETRYFAVRFTILNRFGGYVRLYKQNL